MNYWLVLLSFLWASTGLSEGFDIPLYNQGASTLYVNSTIQGSGESRMLVDTGSGHTVINEVTLSKLITSGDAEFLRNIQAMMADGKTTIVPLYRISAITLGDVCVIYDIEVAVLPKNTRQILGISALQKTAPFGFSFDPPILSLSKCGAVQTASDESEIEATTTPTVETGVVDNLSAIKQTGAATI